MEGLLRIGDFSAVCRLNLRTLRHYQDVGLLEPAHVDPATGYRWYRPDQVSEALVIRALRDLDLPIPDVAEILAAPDAERRTALLDRHRLRLQSHRDEVDRRLTAVRALLEEDLMIPTITVTDHQLEPVHVVSSRAHCPTGVEQAVIATAFHDLGARLAAAGVEPTGHPVILVHAGDEDGSDQEACLPVPPGTDDAWLLDGTWAGTTTHEGPLSDSQPVVAALLARVVEAHGSYQMPIRCTLLALPPLFGEGNAPIVRYAVPYGD